MGAGTNQERCRPDTEHEGGGQINALGHAAAGACLAHVVGEPEHKEPSGAGHHPPCAGSGGAGGQRGCGDDPGNRGGNTAHERQLAGDAERRGDLVRPALDFRRAKLGQ